MRDTVSADSRHPLLWPRDRQLPRPSATIGDLPHSTFCKGSVAGRVARNSHFVRDRRRGTKDDLESMRALSMGVAVSYSRDHVVDVKAC